MSRLCLDVLSTRVLQQNMTHLVTCDWNISVVVFSFSKANLYDTTDKRYAISKCFQYKIEVE